MWPKKAQQPPPEPVAAQPEPLEGLLHRLDWTVLRPLATRLGGDQRSVMRGAGMELSEVREYQPGDDVRYIDWNITARSDTPYIRESHVERALDVWLVLDLSASVDWGTAQATKRERATEFAAAVGQMLGRHGNRIGAVLFADKPLALIPPSTGRTHLRRMLSTIQAAPRQPSSKTGSTDFAAALSYANTVIRHRALLLIVSDFLTADGWQPQLGRLGQRHEVIAVQLRDPRENELPDIGLVTLEDPETGQQMLVDTRDRKLRERFKQAAEAQAERLRTELATCGAEQLIIRTDDALLVTLVRFLQTRRLRRRTRKG